MFKITHAQLTRRAIGYRTFATQSNSSGGNSNGLALAAAGALGIAGYMYYNSSNDKNRTENPMVNEKVAAGKTKSPGEVEQETKAKRDVKDTSTLVEKDTGKVKGVWKDNDKDSQPKATPSTPSTSSTPASLSKNEDTSSKVDHDSSDADKHWDVKSKIDTDRFGGDKDLKTQAESKINEFRKSSVDNLNELGNEAKNDLTTLKEKAGEQVETAKEWAQEGVQEIQDGLQKAQEKVSNAISKDK